MDWLDRLADELVNKPKPQVESMVTPTTNGHLVNGTKILEEIEKDFISAEEDSPPIYEVVVTEAQVAEMVAELWRADFIGFDSETYSPQDVGKPNNTKFHSSGEALLPTTGKIRTLQFSTGKRIWVVYQHKVSWALLRPILEGGPIKIIHGATFDLAFVRQASGIVVSPVVDTLLMGRILPTRITDGNDLESLVQRYLNITLDKRLQGSNWSGDLTPQQLTYAAWDVKVLPDLYRALRAEILARGLDYIYELDHLFLPECVDMEYRGVRWNRHHWQLGEQARLSELVRMIAVLNEEFDGYLPPLLLDEALVGIRGRKAGTPINWRSPDQLKPLLWSLGVKVPNCQKKTLERASVQEDAHPILQYLLPVRKLLGFPGALTLKKLDALIGPDGKFHPRWDPSAARTGRMSCSDPPLQQIPRGQEWRRGFIPSEGYVFGVLDLSQIESRVLAEVTQDPSMVQALRDGLDIHKWTAATLLDKPYEDVTQEERDWGKVQNLAISYGFGTESLAISMSDALKRAVSVREAKKARAKYFLKFRGVKAWQDRQAALLKLTGRWLKDKESGGTYEEKVGETTTLLGRRSLVTTAAQAWNYPIQGSAADAFKEAVVILRQTQAESGGAYLVMFDVGTR
jgi:DNA polymerase-1